MLFAESGAFSGSTCLGVFLVLALIGWAMNKQKKEKEKELERKAQRYYLHQPPPPSKTRGLITGVGAALIGGLVKGWLGHHGHHNHHHHG